MDGLTTFRTMETMVAVSESDIIRARLAHRQWFLRRTTGAHRGAEKVQSALNRLQQYLKGYPALVEIVKQADPKFGGLAYGTISTFLVVSGDSVFACGRSTCTLGFPR